MRAGQLRHRIIIEAFTESPDSDSGEPIRTWGTVATRWGTLEPLSGRELERAQQIDAEATVQIRMRFYAGLAKTNRLRNGTRIFDIVSISDPQTLNHEHIVICNEPS